MNNSLKRLKSVQRRIEEACICAGRRPDEVSLLAVSKRQPAEKVITLSKLGVVSFGENQLQEALEKQQELDHLGLQWHFVGTVQSNKTRAIAEHFQWVQSVDRLKILKRLSAQRPDALAPLNICLQVNIDREPQKAGASPDEILPLAEFARSLENIKLRGLMALPRLSNIPSEQHTSFRNVRILYEKLKNAGHDLDTLSIGMSSDLEIAISEGSTMVRIGTDLFGKRAT
ncbi:MAG: YggS family pyridoxal phosphate-dependent enzyme [Gammaproteobacteria bacterium]|nr:YggS family pyridoxal phosphate-dependent enzyme [Gammaproteobacteria bacterium]